MTEKIKCPQCNTENDLSSTKCLNCGFNLKIHAIDSESEPDWLALLRDSKEDDQSEESNLPDTSEKFLDPDANGEIPNWLNRIRESKQAEDDIKRFEPEITEEPHPPSSTDNFDLVHSLRDDNQNPDENQFDWLTGFRNIQEPGDIEESIKLEKDDEEIEEEITSLPPIMQEIKKNWQIEFPNSLNIEDDENITPAEEFPDWLSKNITNISEDDEILNVTEVPNWLTPDQELPIEEDPETKEPFNLPEWLSKASFLVEEDIQESSELENLELGKSDNTENLPDWIKDINQGKEKQFLDESTSEEQAEAGINESYDSILLFNKLDISPDSKTDDNSKPDNFFTKLDELEEEINALGKDRPEEPAFILEENELKSLSVKPFIGIEDSDDWFEKIQLPLPEEDVREDDSNLKDLQPKKDGSDIHVLPFKFDNVPDWLENIDFDYKEIEPQLTMVDEKNSESLEADRIEKGNLPDWLKAIRPIEVVSPDVSKLKPQKKIEKSGPLAGLQGVLTSESLTKTYSPPPAYSVTIEITDKQKSHLRILEEIISPELQKVESKKKAKSLLHRMEIFLIPAFLLLVITYSLFVDTSNINFPEILPADAVRFHNLATGYLNRDELPSHVLVVFETEASSYPEMNLISEGFFENLFINNHWVTTISSNPNGVLLSEEILRNAHFKVPSYNFEERNTNLGFLPGYGIGIQAFLSFPQKTSPGIDINLNIWEKPPLSEIITINDFDMIILVTDNSENAKLWIEQINFLVTDSNLLLISSAKASPLLQPYLQTNQIDGMLSGIMGGLAFNLLSQSETNNIGRYWAIVRLAAIVFVFFILAGGVISIFKKALSSEDIEKNK